MSAYDQYPANYPPLFRAFHDGNEWVYAALVRHARELLAAGWKEVGIRYLYEHLRYSRSPLCPLPKGYEYGLNNSFAVWYSRLIESQEPDLAGFFRRRRLEEEPGQVEMEFD